MLQLTLEQLIHLVIHYYALQQLCSSLYADRIFSLTVFCTITFGKENIAKAQVMSDFISKSDHMMSCVWFQHRNMKCFIPARHETRLDSHGVYFCFELLQNSVLYLITSPQETPRLEPLNGDFVRKCLIYHKARFRVLANQISKGKWINGVGDELS